MVSRSPESSSPFTPERRLGVTGHQPVKSAFFELFVRLRADYLDPRGLR